ncbi:hypothetical protein LTR84_004424 [Exophiala bonariae]|uniref:Transcription factor domain-containing protein n=1 Tax=Exophiala bonariae TaxID=1690606 RepID=A0AAV9N4L6_9EURO|nr:hypothetical protein LTR84_004424 [Exophiala bonariae]
MGGQLRLHYDSSDPEYKPETERCKGKATACCNTGIVSLTLSPTALDSYRGDLLAALPFGGGPNAFNSIDESAQSLYEFRRWTGAGAPEPSSVANRLYGKAIRTLQKRLSERSAYLDDNVLFSVVHLMIASAGQHDVAAVKQHLTGLRQIISLRGGLSKTPSHLSIRSLLIIIEYFMALEQYLGFDLDDLESIPSSRLHYTRHPFPPQLCRHIAALPDGFAEVALSGRISVQCIQLLCAVSSWQSLIGEQLNDTSKRTQDIMCRLFCEPRECARDAALLLLYLKRTGISPGLEYVIGIGIAICVRHLSEENRTSVFDGALLRCMLDNIKAIRSPQPSDIETVIWLALIVNWRTQSYQPVREADDVLDHVIIRFPSLQSWQKVSKICCRFWWFDCLKDDLLKCWEKSTKRTQRIPKKKS